MKYLLVDILFAFLYVVVLLLGVFSFLGVLMVLALLLVVLVLNFIYKFTISAKPENMNEEFVRREERRARRMGRRDVINRMVAIVDSMIIKAKNLRLWIRQEIFVKE